MAVVDTEADTRSKFPVLQKTLKIIKYSASKANYFRKHYIFFNILILPYFDSFRYGGGGGYHG